MSTPDNTQRFPRGRFMLQHLAILIFGGAVGASWDSPLPGALAVFAPLLTLRRADRRHKLTVALSIVLALLLVAGIVGLGWYLFARALAGGRV